MPTLLAPRSIGWWRSRPSLIVGAIQWGGATPSQLSASRLVAIAERLALRFDRLSGAEISMEVDPRYCETTSLAR